MSDKPFRLVPRVTPENEHYWKGGAEGELRFLYCAPCDYYVHPPQPLCPLCLKKELQVRAVSGRATLLTYTINHQPWIPGFDPPYVVAIVEIEEQEGLRITTNLVNCSFDDVAIGMSVRACFEEYDEVWLPMFEPAA
jgi:uncharacterized OB-fold protein